jgi:glycosyltransferase involved in cell wall biosynthesis
MAECSRIHVSQGWLADVRPWYAAADALVHPSWREGFPNVVIEAGAMGLPAIVTDINGSREIILPEENGVIVPPRNEEALYAQMLRFATRPEEREKMATCARENVAGRYEQHFIQDCLKAYYHKILS